MKAELAGNGKQQQTTREMSKVVIMQHKTSKKERKSKASFSRNEDIRNKKGYLPEDTMSYYRRIPDALEQLLDNDEEKRIFLKNTISSLAEEIVLVAQNQTVSSIIESLIAFASPSDLRTLFVAIVSDLSVAFLDRFASHVFESLIHKLPNFFQQLADITNNGDSEDDIVSQDRFLDSFEKFRQYVDSNFEVLLTHTYGSHVLRALFEGLSGVPVAQELKKSQKSRRDSHHSKVSQSPAVVQKGKLPEEFKQMFDTYTQRILQICDYEAHLKDPFFSLILQALLLIWHQLEPSVCQTHCQNIVQQVIQAQPRSQDTTQCIPDVIQDAVGSHLLEVAFKLSSTQLQHHVYESLLQGHLLLYAIHPVANYLLQRFISSVKEGALMEKLFEEMSQNIEDIMAVGYFGLVTCLAEACQRLHKKQEEFTDKLMEAFHCKEPAERQRSLTRLITSFMTYEVFFNLEENTGKPAEGTEKPSIIGPISIHSSLLLQQLLQFHKPKHAALSILDLQPEELKTLCCDPSGSHVVDVFFSSPTVLEKNKDTFLKKMKGLLGNVACTKNGSRCLESIWKNLNLKQRTNLAEELTECSRLHNDRFGHFLYYNFGLEQFISKRKIWLERQGAQTKRKRMLKEILHSTEIPGKKKMKEDLGVNLQQEEEQEDSVTALFIKQMKGEIINQGTAVKQPSQDNSREESGFKAAVPVQSQTQLVEIEKGTRKKKDKNFSPLLTGEDQSSGELSDFQQRKKKRKSGKDELKKKKYRKERN